MQMQKYLVNGPHAVDFLETALTETGTRAMLGDPKIEAMVGVDIVNAHIALREGTKKVVGLVNDPTRTDVSKHAVAKKLADSVIEKLARTRSVIENRANHLESEGFRMADIELGPKPERAALDSEIRGWIRETLSKGGDGIGVVRETMKQNESVAAILWHSPRFLLGLPEDVYGTLRYDALETHRPSIYASLTTSYDLKELLGKYDKTIRKVQSSFYNQEMANAAAKRVEV